MGQEQREHERVPSDFLVKVGVAGRNLAQEASCRNLSTGGLFIEMKDPLPRGTSLKLVIRLDPVGQTVYAEGVVVWSRPPMPDPQFPPGVGVRFTSIAEEARQHIALTVEKLKRPNSHPSTRPSPETP